MRGWDADVEVVLSFGPNRLEDSSVYVAFISLAKDSDCRRAVHLYL
jgi:hypothetical protein